MERIRQYPGQEKQVYDFYQQNPQALLELRGPIFEQKVVDYIVEQADVTDKKVSKEELFKDPEDEAEEKPKKASAKKKAPAKKAPAKKPAAKKADAKSAD